MPGEEDENGGGGKGDPKPVLKGRNRVDPDLWALAGTGLELAAGIGVFCLIGWWLDRWLGTDPWLLVIGAGLGFAGGFYNLWKHVKRYL